MLSLGLFTAFLLILNFVSLSLQQESSAASPSLVIHLFRHGARAPLKDTYAKDWSPYLLGELTTIGMREHYLLGAALANNYPDILGEPYNLSKIYVRSSKLARSINSATSQLYGVYQGNGPALNSNSDYPSERAFPPFNKENLQQINKRLNNSQAIPGGFIPITVNVTSDEGGETLLEPTQVCFNLVDDMLENVLGDKATNFWENDLAPTRQALEDLGITINNPYDLGMFGDALVCDYFDDRELPGDIDPQSDLYRNVTFARNWYYVLALWGSQQQRQLLSVPLFNYVFDYFDSKAAGTTPLEFMFLSTAETNLLDILSTLNIVTEECLMDNYRAEVAGQDVPHPNCNYTDFAANIVLELYTNNGQSSVVFKYNDVAIPLCNNDVECSYDDFKSLVHQATNGYTAERYKLDCLGRSLPDLQEVLERLGQAFQEHSGGGGNQDLEKIVSSILGYGDNEPDGGNQDENDNEDESILDHVIEDIENLGNR